MGDFFICVSPKKVIKSDYKQYMLMIGFFVKDLANKADKQYGLMGLFCSFTKKQRGEGLFGVHEDDVLAVKLPYEYMTDEYMTAMRWFVERISSDGGENGRKGADIDSGRAS